MSSNLVKVSMNLTRRDVKYTEDLKNRFHARSNAEVVSAALDIMHYLSEEIKNGKEIRLKDKNGNEEKLVIQQLHER